MQQELESQGLRMLQVTVNRTLNIQTQRLLSQHVQLLCVAGRNACFANLCCFLHVTRRCFQRNLLLHIYNCMYTMKQAVFHLERNIFFAPSQPRPCRWSLYATCSPHLSVRPVWPSAVPSPQSPVLVDTGVDCLDVYRRTKKPSVCLLCLMLLKPSNHMLSVSSMMTGSLYVADWHLDTGRGSRRCDPHKRCYDKKKKTFQST